MRKIRRLAAMGGTRPLSDLRARLILIHGRKDDMIPYTESIRFHRALADGQSGLFVVDGLLHVELQLGLWDKRRPVQAVHEMLKERRERARKDDRQ